ITARWLYITQKWAINAQSGMVHFGNGPNGRLENAYDRLKDRIHPLTHRSALYKRCPGTFSGSCELHTSYHSWFKHPDATRRLTSVLENAHARSTRRWGSPAYIRSLYLEINRGQAVRTLLRWLSDYNLPEERVPLTLVPKPPPTAFDALRKQLNGMVDELQGLEPRKATAIFKQSIVHGQTLLRQGSKPATDGLPSVGEDNAPQPRWQSRDTDLALSVLRDWPNTTSDHRCATIRASYYADIARCVVMLFRLLLKLSPQKNTVLLLLSSRPVRKTQRCACYPVRRERLMKLTWTEAQNPSTLGPGSLCVSKEELPDSRE
ncbi:hypothetical protein CSKR_106370, partial [Clonorchis sinensis]